PDRDERMKEIDDAGLWRRFTFWFVRTVPGEGHDQLVDDMFTSQDGRFLYVSRPSFADVVAIDVNSGQIVATAGVPLDIHNWHAFDLIGMPSISTCCRHQRQRQDDLPSQIPGRRAITRQPASQVLLAVPSG